MIGNTAKQDNIGWYLTPLREFDKFFVSGVVVYNEEAAKYAAKLADNKVDYILVDSEKKIPKKSDKDIVNVEKLVKKSVSKTPVISYKANDLSADAADRFIENYFTLKGSTLGGKKLAIIGMGNIGFKLSLKLVERGANVHLFRRDENKLKILANAINQVKPFSTMAKAFCSKSIEDACKNADAVIGVTNGIAAIEKDHIKRIKKDCLLLDIGKGSFSQEAILEILSNSKDIFRLSIESSLEGLINALLSYKNNGLKYGRLIYHNIKICSGGLVAMHEEIVVDDVSNPKIIYGMGDGRGDFIRELSESQKETLSNLDELIKKSKG
jgi:predicted dinucleotide-utilizing enzyme